MKTKTLVLAAVCLAAFVGSTNAATVFRISVDGQADILAAAPPVERGSVTLVRRLSDGQMMAIPSELVRAMSAVSKTGLTLTNRETGKVTTIAAGRAMTTLASSKSSTLSRASFTTPLVAGRTAGTTIVLGSTGGRTVAALAGSTLVVSAPRSATPAANPIAASLEAQVFRGDLPRATPRGTELTVGTLTSSPTLGGATTATPVTEIGPNGFPISPTLGGATTITPVTQIGPNGFPIFAGVTIPPLATVGPNGFLTTTAIAPQSGFQPINPNGFPDTTVAPFAQTAPTVAGNGGATTIPQATSASSGAVIATAPATSVSAPAAGGAATASPQ